MSIPRITCSLCSRSVADVPKRSDMRRHNCPHGIPCREKAYALDTSGMPPEQAERARELDAWSRKRFPRSYLQPCEKCAAERAAKLSRPVAVPRPLNGSISIITSRRAAERMPGLRIGEVRDVGGDLVSVSVPDYAAGALVTGQVLVKAKPRRRERALHA